MASETFFDKAFHKTFDYAGTGSVVGLGVGVACILGLIHINQLNPLSDTTTLVTGLCFGPIIVGFLAAVAAGKIFENHMGDRLPEERSEKHKKEETLSFFIDTGKGEVAGIALWMITISVVRFSPLQLSGDALNNMIPTVLSGFILLGTLIGAARGLYRVAGTKFASEAQQPNTMLP